METNYRRYQKQVPQKQSAFTPYQSPMMMFRDYRYHPDYLNNVAGGYQSLTYSHQIKDEKPLCPIETQGETCNDNDCDSQHFRSMGITGIVVLVNPVRSPWNTDNLANPIDNVLLQQMGTEHVPVRSQADREKWNNGLQMVIRDLKRAYVKDAATIAARIAEYRRAFVEDPTKVVYLD